MITVFTPTYNRAYIIRKLYKALCGQINKNFEWLVVDDGSTDNTEFLIKDFVAENKIKIKYITQLPNTQVPSFVYFANLPQYVKEPYRRFLENKMREKWKLTGTPINIYIRQK